MPRRRIGGEPGGGVGVGDCMSAAVAGSLECWAARAFQSLSHFRINKLENIINPFRSKLEMPLNLNRIWKTIEGLSGTQVN